MKLQEMTWEDFQSAETLVGLIPTGSTEQHGPHGPFATDLIIAEEMAANAAEETGALVLPSISVGISREHQDFEGSLYISPDTFRQQLREMILSASSSGIERFVVVNGHGGNISAIYEVCKSLYIEYTTIALEWTWFNAISARNMGHAGELETSLLMFLRPDLVKEPREPGAGTWGHKFHGTRVDYLTSSFTKNGIVGDPTKATKEKGEELFNRSTKKLKQLIRDLYSPDQDFLSEKTR
ncbi:creatininase family protein [Candidatus Bipolaricaulota bacterium]|nr:creatininase family protein [Candidatus Bipolaricaulota bacterium]